VLAPRGSPVFPFRIQRLISAFLVLVYFPFSFSPSFIRQGYFRFPYPTFLPLFLFSFLILLSIYAISIGQGFNLPRSLIKEAKNSPGGRAFQKKFLIKTFTLKASGALNSRKTARVVFILLHLHKYI
jgi:hypothetical protein